jgi:hypothetical protein
MEENMTQTDNQQVQKRPYAAPRLKTFGDVREITLTSATQNKNDPGNSSVSRT